MKSGNNEKLILGSIGIFIVGLIFGSKKNRPAKEQAKASDEIKKELETGMKASYPLSSYEAAANQLVTATFDVGTDEKLIFYVFKKLKNDIDYLYLVKAFGSRPYYVFGIRQGNWTLTQWLAAELSASELNEVNKILIKNKIKYRI